MLLLLNITSFTLMANSNDPVKKTTAQVVEMEGDHPFSYAARIKRFHQTDEGFDYFDPVLHRSKSLWSSFGFRDYRLLLVHLDNCSNFESWNCIPRTSPYKNASNNSLGKNTTIVLPQKSPLLKELQQKLPPKWVVVIIKAD